MLIISHSLWTSESSGLVYSLYEVYYCSLPSVTCSCSRRASSWCSISYFKFLPMLTLRSLIFEAIAMMTNTFMQEARDVTTTLNYFKDAEDGSAPQPIIIGRPETYYGTCEVYPVTVRDIRGSEYKYTLDTTGFRVVEHESKEREFTNIEQIKKLYFPEVEDLLKRVTGASKVLIFDYAVRGAAVPPREDTHLGAAKSLPSISGPLRQVHIDQSYRGATDRLRNEIPSEADVLLLGRYQIINVWRPIKTIFRDPLGVADARSVQEDELVPIRVIFPNREGERFIVRGSKEHKWYYIFGQTPREVMLIKCFDSKTDGRPRRTPHSAFVSEDFVDKETRESIEVRAFVFHPDDTE
ncbi:hypothetical protein F5884DRAFT_804205 [Xylogone sp. PMI_703]|nr:hypothetical protein F5884DRAFT_804205 [Xylogone sp. PMI_703]